MQITITNGEFSITLNTSESVMIIEVARSACKQFDIPDFISNDHITFFNPDTKLFLNPEKTLRGEGITDGTTLELMTTPVRFSVLNDGDIEPKIKIIEKIKGIDMELAVPFLLYAMSDISDTEGDVRWEAREALVELGEESLAKSFYDFCDNDHIPDDFSYNSHLVSPLLRMLRKWDTNTKKKVAKVLGEWRCKDALDPFIEIISSSTEDNEVKMEAAESLGKLRDYRAVAPLIDLLNNDDINVKIKTVEALGMLGAVGAAKSIILQLKDKDSVLRAAAANALGKISLKIYSLQDSSSLSQIKIEVKDALVEALKDNDGDVREESAEALGRLEDVRAVPSLIPVLGDALKLVREAAEVALRNLGEIELPRFLCETLNGNMESLKLLVNLNDDRAKCPLILASNNKSDNVAREMASIALGYLDEHLAYKNLVNVLMKSGSDRRRAEAARALGKLGKTEAVGFLLQAVQNNSINVKVAVIETLGELEYAGFITLFMPMLKDNTMLKDDKDNKEKKEVRKAVALALGRPVFRDASGDLIELLKEGDGGDEVILTIIVALGKIGDPEAIEPLSRVLKCDYNWLLTPSVLSKDCHRDYCLNAANALADIGPPAIRNLLKFIEDAGNNNKYVLLYVINALNYIVLNISTSKPGEKEYNEIRNQIIGIRKIYRNKINNSPACLNKEIISSMKEGEEIMTGLLEEIEE